MQSPSYHGYDVTDYYRIERDYGTNEDFRRFMTEARARGIKVVIDLVLNHASSQHPFFINARNDNGAYRDWFVWSPTNPGYSGPWEQPVWHRSGGDYYFGLFWSGMPDWNFRNEAVTAEMYEATRFWLEDMDVDGFRLDAIRYLYENEQDMDDVEETHAWLQDYVAYYKGIRPEAMTVGEVWADAAIVASYAGEMDLNFQFDLAGAILDAVRTGNGIPLEANLQTSWDAFAENQFATFLTNHDQDRVMSVLQGDEGRARLAASLLLTIPGVPFLYYGEEIGMRGVKPDPLIRTPLQWSPRANAGFSNVSAWQAPNEDYPSVNIAAQQADPDSLWSLYRDLIALRGANEALRVGNFTLTDTSSANILAFLRQSPGDSVLVLANLGDTPISDYTVGLDAPYGGAVERLHQATINDSGVATVNGISGFTPISTLDAHTLYVIHF
jgi:glycosidase